MNHYVRFFAVLLLAGLVLTLALLPGLGAGAFSGTPTPTPASEVDLAEECRQSVEDLQALLPGTMPDSLMRENGARSDDQFDVQTFFSALDHLSLPEGMVLDWVYFNDGMGGFPVLYLRPADQERYLTFMEYSEKYGEDWTAYPNYLDNVITDGTAESYLQLVLLDVFASQFYLFWHANYRVVDVLCGMDHVAAVVEDKSSGDFGLPMSAETIEIARALDVSPLVTLDEDTARVEIVIFSDWGGFIRQPYIIQRDTPHHVTGDEYEVLAPYDCGIMF